MAVDAERAAAREKVTAAAYSGDLPSAHYSPEDLAWCFVGCEDELERLEAHAVERREALKEIRLRAQAAELVPGIIAEWAKKEQAELRARAVAEARRRVGLEEPAAS